MIFARWIIFTTFFGKPGFQKVFRSQSQEVGFRKPRMFFRKPRIFVSENLKLSSSILKVTLITSNCPRSSQLSKMSPSNFKVSPISKKCPPRLSKKCPQSLKSVPELFEILKVSPVDSTTQNRYFSSLM